MSRLQAQIQVEEGTRVIRPNYQSVTGWIAGNNKHETVQFESTLERDCAYLAMFEPRITKVISQPITILFNRKPGRAVKYTPDFELTYLDNGTPKKAIIEVKPIEKLHENIKKLSHKFEAMKTFAAANEATFHVLTENQLREGMISNVKALYARIYDRSLDTDNISEFLRKLEPVLPITMKDALILRGESREQQARTQTIIWSLLAGHEIYVDLSEKITPDTLIETRKIVRERDLFFLKGEDWENV